MSKLRWQVLVPNGFRFVQNLKGEESREFGVTSRTPKRFCFCLLLLFLPKET